MRRSKRLLPIHKINEHEEKKSAQMLAQAHQMLREEQSRLAELVAYRQSYIEEFQSLQQTQLGVDKLTHIQQFLGRLNDTIHAQQNIVQRYVSELEMQRQRWRERHIRTEALNQAIARFSQQELEVENRQNQKLLDEIGVRSSHSRRR